MNIEHFDAFYENNFIEELDLILESFLNDINESRLNVFKEYRKFKETERNFLKKKAEITKMKEKAYKTHNLSLMNRVRHLYLQWKVRFNKFMFWWYKKKGIKVQADEWETHYEMAKKELARFRKLRGVKMKETEIFNP